MKQPKFFFKSTPGSQRVPVTVTPDNPGNEEVLPDSLIESFSLSSRTMFTIGASSLLVLLSLSFLPQLIRSHPLPLNFAKSDKQVVLLEQKGGVGIQSGLQFDAKTEDGRIEIVAGFLARYNSPLKPPENYAKVLVETADRYNLDFRLLPAIMMQESNLCKTSDPAIHNCLGFGIHKAGTLAFDSYEEGFDRAARELKERYIDIGLTTPEQIMTKYTPSSNGSWANSVNQWIAEMEFNSRQKGLQNDQDMDLTTYSK